MMDYEQLVKSLRCYELSLYCNECEYGKWDDEVNCWYCDGERRDKDAADAIEALQTENTDIREELFVSQRKYDNFVAVASMENAMLARQMPKRGEWIVKGANRIDCSVCGHSVCFAFGLSEGSFDSYKYCPECGAKMEVQE